MGSLNLVSTTTEQTGRPRGTDHPSQIKYNVFYKSLSPLNVATHIWQQVTEHIHTLPEHLVSAVPGSQAMPEEWEENTIQLARTAGTESCRSHGNSHIIPDSSLPFSPHCYRNVKKAYYSYCQGNYLLFQIQRGVTNNFHDHSCCSLKRN